MRTFLIIAAVTLLAFGCDKKEDQGTSTPPQSSAVKEQQAEAVKETTRTPETKPVEAVVKSTIDPVFKDYIYPNSKLENTASMSNKSSAVYKTPDDFAKIVEFYKQKFPDTPVQPGTSVYLDKTNEDGSVFTVILTKLNGETQIILRHDKKM
jgi:hypothetical protein